MTPPRSPREWAVGLISTVVTGIGGGAIAIQYFRLQEWVDSVTGPVALGGLIFDRGLSGSAIVRRDFDCIFLAQRQPVVALWTIPGQPATVPRIF